MPSQDRRPQDHPGDPGPAPGISTRRLRAQAQRDFELKFFAELLERDPSHVAVLKAHAGNLAARGEHGRALLYDRRLVRLRPDSPICWYNLACSYAVLGMIAPAFAALERALRLGYWHIGHLLRDPDLRLLRRDPRFADLLRHAEP